MVNRLHELRDPLQLFLESKNSQLTSHLQDVNWLATLAYLADIFEHLNTLNSSIQGSHKHLITVNDKEAGFIAKQVIWQQRIVTGVVYIFFLTLVDNFLFKIQRS